MTPPPQQEYIITEEELKKFEFLYVSDVFDKNTTVWDRQTCIDTIRSRKTPAPAAPEEALTDAYRNGYIDGQSKAAIENERINATIRNQMLDDAAKDLKTMENTATLRYESATTKNEEVYQQGIVMGLQMAQKSLRTPSTNKHQ